MMERDWIERLVKERNKANKRLDDLVTFMDSEHYGNIAPEAQQLMLIQSTAMATYVNAMNGRLNLLGGYHEN